MKKIACFGILAVLVAGYIFGVPQVREPVDKTIVFTGEKISEWWWLFHKRDCGPIEERQKGYCGDLKK